MQNTWKNILHHGTIYSKIVKSPAPTPKFEHWLPTTKNRMTPCLQTLRLRHLSIPFWHEEHMSLSTAPTLIVVHIDLFQPYLFPHWKCSK
jgi:hypothetical protein